MTRWMALAVALFGVLLLCGATARGETDSVLSSGGGGETTALAVVVGCEYYVSAQRGSDSHNDEGSLQEPFRSLQHALEFIINSNSSYEVAVCVEAGNYNLSSPNTASTQQGYLRSFPFPFAKC